MPQYAPVALFVYKRLQLTIQAIEALKRNNLAGQSHLYIFSDAAKSPADESKVGDVRQYIASIDGFAKITIVHAAENQGCPRSVVTHISKLLDQYGKVIVVEDDLVVAPNFLDYMNTALDFYADKPRVFSIGGWNMALDFLEHDTSDVCYLPRSCSWGWATWKDRWEKVDWDMSGYETFRADKAARKRFNLGGSDLFRMLDRQMTLKAEGKLKPWAVSWDLRFCYAQAKLDAFTVFPKVAKAENRGFGQEATHTVNDPHYAFRLDDTNKTSFNFSPAVDINPDLLRQFTYHFSIPYKIKNRLRNYLSSARDMLAINKKITAFHHTLFTNVIQQLCAALVLLYLPNILGKPDYAQVVYVSVLLSFFSFADFGLSMVYGRVVPALLAQDNHDEVHLWNKTTLAFGMLASAVYSLVIALLYYLRYGHPLNTLLLLPVPFVVFWFSFHISCVNAKGDFSQYCRVNSWRSVASLVVFPLAFLYGLTGWFIAQLAAALIALSSLGRQLLQPIGRLHWPLVRQHLREGLMLSSISILWMQLLNFGRLYASVSYPADTIAGYGIISAAYQSLSTLVISVFLPIMVGIQRRYGESHEKALAFAGRGIMRSLPWVMVITVLAVILEPPVFRFCFPAYHFHGRGSTPMFLSVIFHPFFLVYGSLMVASKRSRQFLTLVVACLFISGACAGLVDIYMFKRGAAWGQLFGLMVYTFSLFFMIAKSAREYKSLLRPQAYCLAGAFTLCAIVLGVRAML